MRQQHLSSNVTELSGPGCAWHALVKASRQGHAPRWFIGAAADVRALLGKTWTVVPV
jgi:hypothetical protein